MMRSYNRVRFATHLVLPLALLGLMVFALPASAQACAVWSLSASVTGHSAVVTGSFGGQGGPWSNWANATVLLDGGPGGVVLYFTDWPETLSATLTNLSTGVHTLNWTCATNIGYAPSKTYYNSGSTSFTIAP